MDLHFSRMHALDDTQAVGGTGKQKHEIGTMIAILKNMKKGTLVCLGRQPPGARLSVCMSN